MSFATLATMALGGAALGALANPEDREKGALMGLGLGALGPLAGMAGIGGGGVLGTSLGAGTAGTATAGGALTAGGTTTAGGALTAGGTTTAAGGTGAAASGTGALAKTAVPVVDLSSTTAAIDANAAALAKEQASKKLAEEVAKEGAKEGAKEAAKKTLGDRASDFMGEALPGMGVAAVQSAMQPKKRAGSPPDMTARTMQGYQPTNPYQRSLVSMQNRMQQKRQPRRFV